MEPIEPYYKFLIWIVVIAGLGCALAPIFVSEARKTSTLAFIATVMCIISIVGGGLSLAAGGALGTTIGIGLFGTLWAASLIVGLAAHVSSVLQRDIKEATFRLLHNEGEGLPEPKTVRNRRKPNTGQ